MDNRSLSKWACNINKPKLSEGNVSYEVFRMLPIEEYFKLVETA